jgi:hypothetical protein
MSDWQIAQLDLNDQLALAKIVARYALLPHPDVVSQIPMAIFPTRRVGKARYEVSECGTFVGDDNVSPRWALLWSHGYDRQYVASGWQVAHVWEVTKDPAAFTALANLAFVPKPLTRLTDEGGPAALYLRYHAHTVYGWRPNDAEIPAKPNGYEDVRFLYLPYHADPRGAIRRGLTSSNKLMRSMKQIGWTI